MGTLYTTTANYYGHTVNTWRATPDHELLDGLIITTFPTPAGIKVRVAVFDPAENLTLPNSRAVAKHAVATTARHFTTNPNPTQAAHNANAELNDPTRTNTMLNPLTTATWIELETTNNQTVITAAGQAGDGHILTIDLTGNVTHHTTIPMLTDEAHQQWTQWVQRHRPTPQQLWEQRPLHAKHPNDYHNTHIGHFPKLTPEIIQTPITVPPGTRILISTDGAELDNITYLPNPHNHIQTIVNRKPKPDIVLNNIYSHSDIATAQITTRPPPLRNHPTTKTGERN